MTISFRTLGLPCALFVLGIAFNAAHAKDPALLSLSAEHFRDTATVADDPQSGMATISTENGFSERRGPMRTVWDDEFLKGVINEKTGQKSFQVSVWISYVGDFRSYQSVSYLGTSGARSVPATLAGKEQRYCAAGACTYTERLTFPIDEALLRQLAAENAPGKPHLWPFKLTAKLGPAYAGGFSTAEIAGFLAKVDDYGNTVKGMAASASLKLDLGISGMPVAATAEQPNRAGILIIGVADGSVARKSGVIVGDIVFEFAGHPIKTLADLQSAVAACAPNSTVAIKLYRGTTAMAVNAQF
jgi:PDZ domain